MLMRIREQKGWIRGIFIALILVFASSFVIGGVGSGSNFSLSDIIGGSGGGSSSTDTERRRPAAQAGEGAPEQRARWTQLVRGLPTNNRPRTAVQAAEHATKLRPNNVEGQDARRPLPAQATALTTQAQNLYTEAYNLQQQDPGSSPFQAVARARRRSAARSRTRSVSAASNQISVQISQLESQSNALATQAQTYNSKALDQYHRS